MEGVVNIPKNFAINLAENTIRPCELCMNAPDVACAPGRLDATKTFACTHCSCRWTGSIVLPARSGCSLEVVARTQAERTVWRPSRRNNCRMWPSTRCRGPSRPRHKCGRPRDILDERPNRENAKIWLPQTARFRSRLIVRADIRILEEHVPLISTYLPNV